MQFSENLLPDQKIRRHPGSEISTELTHLGLDHDTEALLLSMTLAECRDLIPSLSQGFSLSSCLFALLRNLSAFPLRILAGTAEFSNPLRRGRREADRREFAPSRSLLRSHRPMSLRGVGPE